MTDTSQQHTSKVTQPNNVPRRLKGLAHFLDSAIPLPGGRSVGIEAIIGLIPGVGDVFGALASSYIVAEGIGMGAPKTVIARMVFNVLLESTIGVVPIVGDLFDMIFKSNIRNINLLDNLQQAPAPVKKKSRGLRWIVFSVAAASILLIIWLVYRLLAFIGSAIF